MAIAKRHNPQKCGIFINIKQYNSSQKYDIIELRKQQL
jgi:hypothetical protein